MSRARADAAALAEAERQVAAAALRVLPCEDCGREQAAGLCEVCGYRRRTEALTVEAGLVAAAWSAALDDSQAANHHIAQPAGWIGLSPEGEAVSRAGNRFTFSPSQPSPPASPPTDDSRSETTFEAHRRP
ncbi:hypothetical protein OHA84_01170 [Streptomyces sp. NBC_00513]|uniref:hypothetical protein n=1 Tax=unclassified Streptomyces TaxID=2593676 RepID=UPI002258DA3B|nr:hypothetical protein [Streptomyces sp. NBC_00424]WUD39221.1 hypothetical protein OHA84_01170 [Streptomyces sp. NBC_00513]